MNAGNRASADTTDDFGSPIVSTAASSTLIFDNQTQADIPESLRDRKSIIIRVAGMRENKVRATSGRSLRDRRDIFLCTCPNHRYAMSRRRQIDKAVLNSALHLGRGVDTISARSSSHF